MFPLPPGAHRPQHIPATPGTAAPGSSQALAGADPHSQPCRAEGIPGNPQLQDLIDKQGTLPSPAAAPSPGGVTSAAQLRDKYSMAHYPGEESPSPMLLRPGETGSCCLLFAQAAMNQEFQFGIHWEPPRTRSLRPNPAVPARGSQLTKSLPLAQLP